MLRYQLNLNARRVTPRNFWSPMFLKTLTLHVFQTKTSDFQRSKYDSLWGLMLSIILSFELIIED